MGHVVAVVIAEDAEPLAKAVGATSNVEVIAVDHGIAMASDDLAAPLFAVQMVGRALTAGGWGWRAGVAGALDEARDLASRAAPGGVLGSGAIGVAIDAGSLGDVQLNGDGTYRLFATGL